MLLQTITSAVSFQAKNLLEEHPLHDTYLMQQICLAHI